MKLSIFRKYVEFTGADWLNKTQLQIGLIKLSAFGERAE
jgi:hypothetical protein